MLNMILHIPVIESNNWRTRVRTRVKAKVGYVWLHAKVLRNACRETEPGALLCAKGKDNNQKPMSCGYEYSG